jgi:hypothetical protein
MGWLLDKLMVPKKSIGLSCWIPWYSIPIL